MIYHTDTLNQFAWWSGLNHGGLLIAPARLATYFSAPKLTLSSYWTMRLRGAVQAQQNAEKLGPQPALLDVVLEGVLQLPALEWKKASAVGAEWSHRLIHGENLKPRRLWLDGGGAVLPVFDDNVKQIGVGTGRRSTARVIEWLRKSGQKLALLTNGVQWRLIHAGPDYDAWCQWDIGYWFEEGEPSDQVHALLQLLSPEALTPPKEGVPAPLIAAIQDTRKGQAELSANLGERVRLAVEHLIDSSRGVIDQLHNEEIAVSPRDYYIAATRIVMRCVVILFAEARGLLPGTEPVYYDSYSLQGLREQLDRMAGGRSSFALRDQWSAWPRLLSLFSLIYEGSLHGGFSVHRYGGALFQPGQSDSADPILRALALFEHPDNEPTDYAIHHILELLTRVWERISQGRSTKLILSPIDFSDLSTEYIGILYEGLLDFQLRRAAEAIVFLNIGDQPALPFVKLDAMPADEVASLFEKFKVADKKVDAGDDDAEESAEEIEEEALEQADDIGVTLADAVVEEDFGDTGDTSQDREQLRQRIHTWARRAAEAAKMVKKPRGKLTQEKHRAYDEVLDKAAKALVPRVIFPGEWYLVREGNTRKGSGTFYTRPQLSGPITRRALRELAYNGDTPRKPEEILALKICDPACGSGSFLLSALRFLTSALFESLHHHQRLSPNSSGVIVRLADGKAATKLADETVPKPIGDPEFNDYLRAYLRRHIVERCLYGVDLDQLAVELCRLALWIETMDPRLPFGFLDHKIKTGNALIGCWFDRFQDYPVMAWERDGGDSGHERFVHHYREYVISRGKNAGQTKQSGDKWTRAIKDKKETVRVEMVQLIRARRTMAFEFLEKQLTSVGVHDHLVGVFEQIHNLQIHETEERQRIYEQQFGPGSAYEQLRAAFDTWCAIWFWPGDQLEHAPMPVEFLQSSAATKEIVAGLREAYRFFHWELEFPDVFAGDGAGFDAFIGNPPWEVQKPNSKEFFSDVDPLYRRYGKQEALDRQVEYFTSDARIEGGWLRYVAGLKARSNWVKYVAHPFGEKVWYDKDRNPHHEFPLDRDFNESAADHALWEELRKGRSTFADPAHPFLHQGSADLNTYKMFLEAAYSLLRKGGRLALLVPSGIYSDKGSSALRQLFLTKSRWSHLYGFQNERFIFVAVHHAFKVAAIQVEKGGAPGPLRTRFRLGPGDSPEPHELEDDIPNETRYLQVSVSEIQEFSPRSGAILEIRTPRDLEIVKNLYKNGILLGDKSPDGWNIRYATEFHMTNDSELFPPRWKWEEKGYCADEYGHWLMGNWQPYSGPRNMLQRPRELILSADGTTAVKLDEVVDVALPLYQGAMIQQFDFCASAYRRIEGKRGFKWVPTGEEDRRVEPQYLMGRADFINAEGVTSGLKVAYRRIAPATNSRSFICTALPSVPCGDSIFLLRSSQIDGWTLPTVLNSFTFDWITRKRLVGSNLSYFLVADLPLLNWRLVSAVAQLTASLLWPHIRFAQFWSLARVDRPWKSLWALRKGERLRQRVISEAFIASHFGLTEADFGEMVKDCDHPVELVASNEFSRKLDPKGFWRFEKNEHPEHRLAVLAQVAFQDLSTRGIADFLSQNDGEGWMLPDTLRLADYGLGYDDRAKEHQPVASALGPRFYPWQLEQSVEESWEECERHAEVLAKLLPPPSPNDATDETISENGASDLFGNPIEADLFGAPVYQKSRKR
jgi:hypothetical protein